MVQQKSAEFESLITHKPVEVYTEVRTDEKIRKIIVPKTGGKWSGKEGAEKLRKMIDDERARKGLPV